MTARRRAIVAGGATAVAVVAVAGITTLTGRQAVAPRQSPPSPSTLSSPVASAPPAPASPKATTSSPSPVPSLPAGFVEFRDEKAGFSVSYPKDWKVLEVPDDPEVALLAALNQRDSFLVRVARLGLQVGPSELPGMTSVTNQIVTSGEGVKVISGPKQVRVGGLPGYFYLYTFPSGQAGQQGAHSHYFLFKGDMMITLVFQAIPEDQFQKRASVFDQIANSFRVLPG
ncbi:MAG: PsbP-related protein [Egibacteraceae bacterium]